jgi:hypothetical protein
MTETGELELPEVACPGCGHKINRTTCLEDLKAIPIPGDFSLCLNCGEILVCTVLLTPRIPTISELMVLAPEVSDHLIRYQKSIRKNRP